MNNRYLQHYGVLGMKWGVRSANKLSKKYGMKVGVGVKKKEVKYAQKHGKEQLKSGIIEDFSNATVSYYSDIPWAKPMSEKQFKKIQKSADDAIKKIDESSLQEIRVKRENGKRIIDMFFN